MAPRPPVEPSSPPSLSSGLLPLMHHVKSAKLSVMWRNNLRFWRENAYQRYVYVMYLRVLAWKFSNLEWSGEEMWHSYTLFLEIPDYKRPQQGMRRAGGQKTEDRILIFTHFQNVVLWLHRCCWVTTLPKLPSSSSGLGVGKNMVNRNTDD